MKVSFDKISLMGRLEKDVKRAVASLAIKLQEGIKEQLNKANSSLTSGGTPSTPGQPPAKRTGALARSIQAIDVTIDPKKPTYRVGTNLPYARIQEFGGRIVPKKSRYLTVPIGVEGMRAAKRAKGNIRSLNLKPIRTPKGLFLVEWKGSTKKGGASKIKVLFKLVKSVFLPARPYFRPAVAELKKSVVHDVQAELLKK